MPPQRSVYDELLDQQPSSTPPTTKPAGNVYDDILNDPDRYQQIRMRSAQEDASTTTPDKRADVMRIAEAANLPVKVVEQDYENLKKRFTVDQFPYLKTQHTSPALAEWSTDPNHAALAKDDVETMSGIEWILTVPSRAFAQQWNREAYSNLRYKSLWGPLSRDEQDAMASYKFNADRGGQLGVKPGAFGVEFLSQAWAGAARLLAQAVTPAKYAVVGGLETAAVGAAAGSVVPGAGTLVGAKGGFLIGARAGAMYGVFKSANVQEAAATYDELLDLKDEMGQPMDPDVARMAAIGVGAVNGLIEQFGLEAFLTRFPGLKKLSGGYTKQAMKEVLRSPTTRAALKTLAKKYIGGVTAEVGTEVAQQVVTITGEELAKYAEGGQFETRTRYDVWDELVTTAASAIPEFALGMAPGPVLGFAGDVHRAKAGEQTKLMVQALGDGVANSKTYQRMPSAMRKFVDQATKDGPVKELYQPADTWTAYWQKKGQDPREVATAVTGNAEAYDAGLRSGLIVIPTGAYAQNLAGTEHNAFFANEVKLGPDLMNGRESEEFAARIEQLKDEALTAAQAVQQAPDSADAQQLRETETFFADQLQQAGVPRETALQQARGVAGFVVMAQRAGFDPADVLESQGIEIGRVDRTAQQESATGLTQPPATPTEDVPGLAQLEAELGDATIEQLDERDRVVNNASAESAASVEALNRQEGMKARGEQFVVYDRAGRRRALLGPDAVDYAARPGETYGVEGVGGFRTLDDKGGRAPTDRRTSSALGDALSRTLGQPRAVPAVRSGIRFEGERGPVNQKGERAFFIGYMRLTKNGAPQALYNIEGGEQDGSTVDADVLRTMGIAVPETPPLHEFNQRAIAATPALRDWFGNSVVRDESGNPLTVYHGTTRTFTTFDNERANLEADFGAGFYFSNDALDVGENYAGIGPDLKQKMELRAEQLAQERDLEYNDPEVVLEARNEFMEHGGQTMPVFLKIENPAVLGGDNPTLFTYELIEDEAGDFVNETGTLVDFIVALRNAAELMHDGKVETAVMRILEAADFGDVSFDKVMEVLRSDEEFGYFTDENGTLTSHEIVRQALEAVGYDGIVDHTVGTKFKNMKGMTDETVHYIVFDPTQIKSAIGNRGTYDPLSPNILYQSEQMELYPQKDVYYSRLERGIESMKQTRGPGQQWKASIKNLKVGINRDELAIARIEDLDDAQVYTKEEVLAFVRLNRPAANIVALGGPLRTVPSETETDLDEVEEEEEEGPSEEEINERAQEIFDSMVDDAYNNLDDDDFLGSPTYIEDERENEVEVEKEVPVLDDDGNPVLDDDGDPVMETVTEYEYETETVYYPALSGGYRVVQRRTAAGYMTTRLESRGDDEAIEDAEAYDNYRDAERAARDYRADIDREPFFETMHEAASESVEWSDAVREAEEELGANRERERRNDPNPTRTRYSDEDYQLKPAPIPGTYREVFITANSFPRYAPTPEFVAFDQFRKPYRKLNADQKKTVQEFIKTNTSKEAVATFAWRDGHGEYNDIRNPIVRLRMNERESAPQLAVDEAKLAEAKALEAEAVALDEAVQRAQHKHHYVTRLTEEETVEVNRQRAEWEVKSAKAAELRKAMVRKGDRWLFIEEIQPPREDQQRDMPPIFLAQWREIGMKWALREAAERGVAGIAWTTGRQQVERYPSIEEHVREIKWNPLTEASPDMYAKGIRIEMYVRMQNDNNAVFGLDDRGVVRAVTGYVHDKEQFMDQPLSAIVPNEIATQILDPEKTSGELTGKALKIGAKGLASVYDRDLPNVVHDIGPVKELGLRVEKVPFEVERRLDREREQKGDVELVHVVRGTGDVLATFEGYEAWSKAGEFMYEQKTGVDESPGLRLTPELTEKVLGGLALMQSARYRPVSSAELDLLNEQAQAVAQTALADAPEGSQLKVHMTTGGELFIDALSAKDTTPLVLALNKWADEHNIQIAADKVVPIAAGAFFDFERNEGAFADPSSFGTWVRKAKNDTPVRRRQQAKKEPRARVQFYPGKTKITLFENADRSSFLHEIGHLYLEMMGDLVERLDAMPPESLNPKQVQLKADYRTILDFLGAEQRVELTEAQLEKFATGFETYLMEGKAPSLRLREAFARFRVWFKQIYRSLLALNTPLTDDVRKVFDRMLATDEEIDAATIESKLAPMFLTPEAAKMTPQGFALYRQAIEDASREAQEQLDRRLQEEVLREETAAWKARRADVKAQVTRETHALPVYRALYAMRRGTNADGSPITEGVPPTPIKVSKKLAVEQFGAERVKTLPKGILSDEGGVEPQVIADMVGFSSGDELFTTLASAPPMAKRIKADTDARMLKEFGSMLVDNSVQPAARDAVATTEGRELVLREELKALGRLRRTVRPFEGAAAREEIKERDYERRWFEAETKLRIAIAEGYKQVEIDLLEAEVRKRKAQARIGPSKIRGAIPNARDLREQSRAIVAKTKVGDLRPLPFFTAAKQASQKATEAAARQDFDTAITEKQREIVMLSLYRETLLAQQETDKRIKKAQRITTNKGLKNLRQLGETYHDQVLGILDRFGFGTVPQQALDRRAPLDRFLRGIEADGRPAPKALPDIVSNESRRVAYKELSTAELIDVTDSIQQIVHLGQQKQRLYKAERKLTLDQVATEAEQSIRASKKKRAEPPGDRRASEERKRDVRSYLSAHRKLSSLLQQMDGWQSGGVMWRTIMRTLNAAANQEADMNADATKRFGDLVEQAYPRGEKRGLYTRSFVPAIGKSLSKMERLMVALNWGNAGNRDRVIRGRGWSNEQVQAILDTLDERDWIFVQGVWDFFESYWPAIAAKQARVAGVRPLKVDAVPIDTKFGKFRGGYFPLKYDDRISATAADKLDLDAANLANHAAYVHAVTAHGHVEARAATHNDPVRLDFGVIFEHTQQVIHDLTHHEALIDVGRILSHRKVVTAIKEHYGDQIYKEMKRAVRDVAFGDLPATDGFERAFNHVRKGSTVVGLGWNLTTAALQWLGLFNTTAKIGIWYTGRGVAEVLGQPWRMNAVVDEIYAESTFMRTRGLTQQRELNEIRNSVGTYSGQFSSWVEDALSTATADLVTKQGISDSYFYFIQKMQQMVDVPTYLGAKAKALAEGHDDATAIALAEQAVLDTQGGGQVKDLASVQRGGPMKKLFTNFYSYFNVVYNQAVEIQGRTHISNPASLGRAAVDYLMLFIMPATLSYLIRQAMKPGDDDDETLWLELLRENLAYMMGTMVGLREFSSTVQGYYGYEGPAGARFFSDGSKLFKQVTQGEIDEALLKSLNQVGGAVFHYPAAQVWKTLNGLAALAEGETANPLVLITGPEKK